MYVVPNAPATPKPLAVLTRFIAPSFKPPLFSAAIMPEIDQPAASDQDVFAASPAKRNSPGPVMPRTSGIRLNTLARFETHVSSQVRMFSLIQSHGFLPEASVWLSGSPLT